VVDRGGTLGGVASFETPKTATTLDAGAIGDVEVIVGLVTNELRVAMARGRYVRVVGTVPTTTLLAVARALHKVDGGTLTVDPSGQ
jgi:hypothetical protein